MASSTPKTWPNTRAVLTRQIGQLSSIAQSYDALVFDQWGVLHDGTTPYPHAVECLSDLSAAGIRMAVLSNSGKRSAPNASRIASMGFPQNLFEFVMTSGEALWQGIHTGLISYRRFFAIERDKGDAAIWATGLDIDLEDQVQDADALLLMGLPDGADLGSWSDQLKHALDLGLPLFCSNPDRKSPRADGLVISPGQLAFDYLDMGGDVSFYGKPHRPVYTALEAALGTKRLLMIGDSLEHDIAGAQGAGWDSLLIESGIYAEEFNGKQGDAVLADLIAKTGCDAPTYRMKGLK